MTRSINGTALAAALTALLLLAGCDRRPADPPVPSDPGRTTPTPSTSPTPELAPAPSGGSIGSTPPGDPRSPASAASQ